jgi:cytochrome b561
MMGARTEAPQTRRYAAGSIVLHWAIAALILTNIPLGVIGRDAPAPEKLDILAYHKSIGLTVLTLSVLRLAWRLLHRPPALLTAMPRWERALAYIVHVGLYLVMIGVPLTGWIAVSSAAPAIPIRFFGMAPWPYFPMVRSLGADTLGRVHLDFAVSHSVLGKVMLGLLVLHLVGALKHMALRDGIVWRMAPLAIFLPRGRVRDEKA